MCAVLITVIAVLVLVPDARGIGVDPDPVEVWFEYLNNETTMAFVGQPEIGLMVIFNENSTDWEVETDSDLFEYNLGGWTHETIEAGHGCGFALNFDRGAKPGIYNVPVWVRYTDEAGTRQEFRFDFRLEYVKAWEVVDFRITPDNHLVLEIETFLRFDEIRCEFDTDGSVLVDPEWRNMTDVSPGVHTFQTRLYQDKDAPDWDEDEVGYDIRGWVNGSMLALSEKNIDPDSVRQPWLVAFLTSSEGIAIVAVVAAVMVGIVGYVVTVRRPREPRGPVEDAKTLLSDQDQS